MPYPIFVEALAPGEESEMNFFKFRKNHQEKDPRSKSFNKKISDLLVLHGMHDLIKVNLCSLELFWRTMEYYRGKGDDSEQEKEAFGKDLMKILSNYNITDPDEQDSLLCDYFDTLNATLGAEGK
jgi:hypothetical protein